MIVGITRNLPMGEEEIQTCREGKEEVNLRGFVTTVLLARKHLLKDPSTATPSALASRHRSSSLSHHRSKLMAWLSPSPIPVSLGLARCSQRNLDRKQQQLFWEEKQINTSLVS